MGSYSDDDQQGYEAPKQSLTFVEVARETLTFAECYDKIRTICMYKANALDGIAKSLTIARYLSIYFASEDRDDLYEGFMEIICVLHDNISKETSLGQKDLTLAKQVFESFSNHLALQPTEEKDALIWTIPLEKKAHIVQQTLNILAKFKVKHLERIEQIFRLKDARMIDMLHRTIDGILQLHDMPKAIQWMDFYNVRNFFNFDDMICRLFIDNQTALIEQFVGEDNSRRVNFINYLDKLIGCHVRSLDGVNELENQILKDDHKKIEKAVAKYCRLWSNLNFETPNTTYLRVRERLMYNHWRWQKNECTFEYFEEIALHEMRENVTIREFYLDYLCKQRLKSPISGLDYALLFAVHLDLEVSQYPRALRDYCNNNQDVLAKVRRQVKVKLEMLERNQQIENDTEHFLRLDGAQGPRIVIVDTWTSLRELIDVLKDETVIGIDAEWYDNQASTAQIVALLQIATSTAIFLVDVFVLQKKELSDEQWREFLEALLCNERTKKIGYDFKNDMRALLRTFPFLEQMKPDIKNFICLYSLFQKAQVVPEASEILFDSNPPSNMSLADVAKFFLDLEMDKAERVSSWSQRPLRYEQKQYAALDAHCLTKIFRKVAGKLAKHNNTYVVELLQKSALMSFEPEKERKTALMMAMTKQTKEDEKDFMKKVMDNVEAMRSKASTSKSPPEFKSVSDFKFVVDSMLFGLGKKLRQWGFDTVLMGDRNELISFCEQNPDYTALSTGKGVKQIELLLPRRVLNVPVNTSSGQQPSELVYYVIRELNILVRPEDMWSRCVECNKRSFVRVPAIIIQAMYYRKVVQLEYCDWLEIEEEDEQRVITELFANSKESLKALSEKEYDKKRMELADEEYVVFVEYDHTICHSRECSVMIEGRLALGLAAHSPQQVHLGLSFKKADFDAPDNKFILCTECGKVHCVSPVE